MDRGLGNNDAFEGRVGACFTRQPTSSSTRCILDRPDFQLLDTKSRDQRISREDLRTALFDREFSCLLLSAHQLRSFHATFNLPTRPTSSFTMNNNMGSNPNNDLTWEDWNGFEFSIAPQTFSRSPMPAQQLYHGQQAQGGLLLQQSVSQAQIHSTMAYPPQQNMFGDFQGQQPMDGVHDQAAAMQLNHPNAANPAIPNHQRPTAASRARQTSADYRANAQLNVSLHDFFLILMTSSSSC